MRLSQKTGKFPKHTIQVSDSFGGGIRAGSMWDMVYRKVSVPCISVGSPCSRPNILSFPS